MADGNIRVAAITGRKYEKSAGDKIIALFKKSRIPDYKNSGHIYTYSYSTDKKTLKKKSEQQKVVSNFYSTIDKAFSSSTDQDLNVFYYVGHGLPSQSKDNGYGGIPVGFFPGYGISSPSTDFERITYVQLIEALNKYHGKFVVIVDACISGSVIDAAKDTLSSSDLNRYVFLTSTSNKKVAWGPKLSTSINYTLTSKFQKADKNQDGCMSLAELYDYIIKKNGNFRLLQEPLLYTTNRGFFNDLPLFQFNYTKLSASSISVQKNSKKTLKVDIKGPKSIKHKVKYESSNSNVASVNNKGCITGKSAGTAIISVCLTDNNGKECISTKSDCVVKVYEAANIKLNQSAISLYVKENTYLSAAVTGKNSKVTWKSSNTKVAAVNSNGKIKGKKAGSCKITATANEKSAACTVTVKNPASANTAYKKIIQKYESKNGKAKLYTSGYMHYWKGLCFAKLLDFNGDGTKELVLAYQNGVGKTDNIKYHVDLWTYNGKKAKRICSSVSWSGNNCEYFGGFSIAKVAGNYLLYLSDGANGNDVYYGKKSDGTLGAVHSFHWKGDIVDGQWYYNGKAISVNEYTNYYKKFHQSCTIYSFSSDRSDKTIRSELAKTKKTLKM